MAKAVTQYKKALCVRRYHAYKDIWEVPVSESVVCLLEPGNFHDRNSIAVGKDRRIIGHLPQKVSHFHTIF